MPHVAFVPFSGVRIREPEMLELGMTLPGLQPRGRAIGQLPALGLVPQRAILGAVSFVLVSLLDDGPAGVALRHSG